MRTFLDPLQRESLHLVRVYTENRFDLRELAPDSRLQARTHILSRLTGTAFPRSEASWERFVGILAEEFAADGDDQDEQVDNLNAGIPIALRTSVDRHYRGMLLAAFRTTTTNQDVRP